MSVRIPIGLSLADRGARKASAFDVRVRRPRSMSRSMSRSTSAFPSSGSRPEVNTRHEGDDRWRQAGQRTRADAGGRWHVPAHDDVIMLSPVRHSNRRGTEGCNCAISSRPREPSRCASPALLIQAQQLIPVTFLGACRAPGFVLTAWRARRSITCAVRACTPAGQAGRLPP
jgi:hypothetical protein